MFGQGTVTGFTVDVGVHALCFDLQNIWVAALACFVTGVSLGLRR